MNKSLDYRNQMFRIAKYVFYVAVVGVVVFLVWFLPKYSYVQKNPGYCVALTENLYYCGTDSNINDVYGTAKDTKEQFDNAKETYDEVNSSLNP